MLIIKKISANIRVYLCIHLYMRNVYNDFIYEYEIFYDLRWKFVSGDNVDIDKNIC
jgi:hypothetical protein